jgi:hypothetical protein
MLNLQGSRLGRRAGSRAIELGSASDRAAFLSVRRAAIRISTRSTKESMCSSEISQRTRRSPPETMGPTCVPAPTAFLRSFREMVRCCQRISQRTRRWHSRKSRPRWHSFDEARAETHPEFVVALVPVQAGVICRPFAAVEGAQFRAHRHQAFSFQARPRRSLGASARFWRVPR